MESDRNGPSAQKGGRSRQDMHCDVPHALRNIPEAVDDAPYGHATAEGRKAMAYLEFETLEA